MSNRPLVLVVALVVAVGGFYAFQVFSTSQKAAEDRAQLFAETETALGSEGSVAFDKLVDRLKELGEDDREALLLLGRIEAARQRYGRALEYLQGVVDDGGEVALRTAAFASFREQQRGSADAATQRLLLQQAHDWSERAAATSDAPGDWFLCWETATRLADAEASERALAALRRVPDSLEARTAALLAPLRQEGAPMPALEAVSALVGEWKEPPVELELVQAALFLDGQQLDRALAIATALLQSSPNQFEVRQLAATAHHVAVQVQNPGPERERHAAVRDAQIQWLDANAAPDDSRRPLWLSWKQVR